MFSGFATMFEPRYRQPRTFTGDIYSINL
jgi:hypothetical protein